MRTMNKVMSIVCIILMLSSTLNVYKAEAAVPPIASNNNSNGEIVKPIIQSESAVLMDANTGSVLFEKNGYAPYFPASITKIMTALLVLENCELDEVVTFSQTAVTNLESGSVTLNITAGDKLSIEACLYGLLLKSANEVANGLAEHVSGNIEEFTARMTRRAKELGCNNTNFVNANGLNNPNHVTTSYDMALITKAAFQNPEFRKIASTLTYQMPPTSKRPNASTLTMGHKMLFSSDSRYYQGIMGGKTGYTSLAGNTLVTCVEREGRRLIAVVMKSRQTHYQDTKAMLDYGFNNPSIKGSTGTIEGVWSRDPGGWRYQDSDGFYLKNQWQIIKNITYHFDINGYMTVGWKQIDTNWYYLNKDGALLLNTITPDGFSVGGNGVWTP